MPGKKLIPNKQKANSLTIVGLGASAGGLAALRTFFKHVPENSGLAFVVVVHLSPDHESHLADLLQPHVKMPVQQVTKTIPLEANHVYIIPPGRNLNTIDTHLRLSDLEERQRERAPIDHFFRTLANTHNGHAVGVILTGTGSDGTLGIKEIKGQGGLTIVQDPNEAEYDGMPQSALTTGLVDLVLPLVKIPRYILRFAHTEPHIKVPEEGEDMDGEVQRILQKVFAQIRTRTGRDFSRYKRSTIMRRIQRRMQLSHIEKLENYLLLLREKPEELQALSDEFLITVTNFFRDAEVFQQLEEEVIPSLFKKKGPNESVRVWSVGCATGEEAYSLTILLLEEASRHEVAPELQIFASDLHEHSLQKAREGFYPGDIATDVSLERLHRFFVKEDMGYRIRKEVRELVVFAPHNLLGDPPFSRLDFIVCRNVLIYLQRDVQRDVIELFHYALRPEGCLLLGTSETIESADLFHTENKAHCLFRKRNVQAPEPRLPVFPLAQARMPGYGGKTGQQEKAPVAYGVLHQRIVELYAPPSLLVSPDYKVVHLSEHVGRYLMHPGGEVTSNVFKLVREEFRIELRSALYAAKEKGMATQAKPILLRIEGKPRRVMLSVYPAEEKLQRGFAVVIFDEGEKPNLTEVEVETAPGTREQDDATLHELQKELDHTKQQLQAIIEEYETSQEEMKASNEEMQSTNEELRSTLEELETSKEELQSMNEELTTLNQENRHKVEELTQLTGDLQNLLKATDIATLFLDRQLRILRFTPQVGELFNVRLADRGRLLSDLTHRLGYDELLNDAQKVLDKLLPIEREIQDEEQRWYLTRVLPYRNTDDRIEGIVITFIDITKQKQSEKALKLSERRLEQEVNILSQIHRMTMEVLSAQSLQEAVHEILSTAIELLDADFGNIQLYNPEREGLEIVSQQGFDQDFLNKFELVGMEDNTACGQSMRTGRRIMVKDVQNNKVYAPYRDIAAKAGYQAVQSSPLISRSGEIFGILSTHYRQPHALSRRDERVLDLLTRQTSDLINRIRTEEALRRSEEHLHLIMTSATDYAIFTLDKNRKITDWNVGAEAMMGYSKEEIIGNKGNIIFTEEDRKHQPEREMQIAQEKGRAENERWHIRKDGSRFWGSGTMMPLRGKDNELRGFLKIMTDNTERRQMEEALRQAKEQAEQAAKAKEDFLAHMSHEIRTPLNAIVGLSALLLQKDPQPSQLENLQALKFSAENLKLLINDILDFSKIQAGKIVMEETDVNLRVLLHNLQKSHELRAKEQGNVLEFHVGEQLPEVVHTDQLKLSQVLHNLIGNAVKFTQKGQVQVEVSLRRKKGKQLWVDFSVRDTGMGIPEDKLSQIFDAFTQADTSTVRPYEGTGLGLSITKLLLVHMDSQIKVESKEGEGTHFFFTLFMKEGAAATSSALATPPSQQMQQDLQNLRVLLVEDNEINRKLIKQFLQQWWQLVPDEAEDGQQAIEMAQKKQYDLILMDIRMPVMDGYEAAKALRAFSDQHYREAPIIALTADTMDQLKKHPEAAYFTDVLTKPFDAKDLRQKIIRHAPQEKEKRSSSTGTGKPASKKKQSQGTASKKKRAKQTTSGMQTASPTYVLNFQKLESFLENDTRKMKEFLEEALKNFTDFQQSFAAAMAKRDEEALEHLNHRKTMLLDMLNLKELGDLLDHSQSFIKENAPRHQINEVQQKVEAVVVQVLASLKEYLKKLK